jgi:CDP-diacylglycerol--inositol 3-phosphatidyltransferase
MAGWKTFFYVPNIIGYLRISASIYSFWIYDTQPQLFLILYFVSFVLDAVDGHAARLLNQKSEFGAVLDMVTDRFSTAALATILSHFYPKFLFGFLLLNILDFVSHWYRMYSSLLRGSESHKLPSENEPAILTFYYNNKIFMAILCTGNELFYIYLYALHFFAIDSQVHFFGFLCVLIPTWGLKQLMNVIQLITSSVDIVAHEAKMKKN